MKKYAGFSFGHAAGFWFLSFFCLFISTGSAESFPFRSVSLGSQLPDVKIVEQGSNKPLHFHELKGKPAVIVFWGADIPSKKSRSVEALSQVQQLTPLLEQRGIRLVVVNVQGDAAATINEVKAEAGLTTPVYLDPDNHAYGTMGIYIMPSFLLTDKDSKIVAGAGYSRQMIAQLKAEVDVLLGSKTREQVEAELHPTNVEQSHEVKTAIRHFGMGKVMTDKGQLEAAVREYQQALASNPKMGEAYIELGCVEAELGKLKEATDSLAKGRALTPNSLRGEICMARIKSAQGADDEALEDLKVLVFRNNREPELHYTIGTIHAKKANHAEAATEFRKAYELLHKRQQFEQHQ